MVLVIVPGPDMAYMLARTIAQGRKAGVVAAIGINVGAYVHVAAVVLGLSAVLATSSIAFTIIKWLGAIYLVCIGIQAVVARSDAISASDGSPLVLSTTAIFWQGFWSDVLNPKVAIFFLTFLPQFVDANSATVSVTQQLLLLGVTSNIVAVCINILLVYFASAATARLQNNAGVVAVLRKAMGAVFVALGVRLASEKF